MDVPKATHIAVLLYWADVDPLLRAVILILSQPDAPQPERIALLSLACQLKAAVRERKCADPSLSSRAIHVTGSCALGGRRVSVVP